MARVGKTKPHIKIGSYTFTLDESIDAGTQVGSLYRPHYRWTRESYYTPATVHSGDTTLRAWFNDFSGGEGNRNWYADDPTVYDFSYGLNPRIRGQLTGRPSRSRDALTGTQATASSYMYFAIAGGALWSGYGCDLAQLDPAASPVSGTWTSYTAGLSLPTDSTYTALGGDAHRVFIGSSLTGNTTFKILAANVSNYKTVTNGALAGMVCELATMHGFLYSLEYNLDTSIRLRRYDISGGYDYNATTNPIGRTSVSNAIPMDSTTATFANFKSQTDTQSWYTGIAPTNNSVFFFVSTPGNSRVWEYRQRDATYPVWTAPDGFTIRDISYQNGYLFIVGGWGSNAGGSGFGSLYVHQKDSQDTIFVADIGRSRALTSPMTVIAPEYAANVFFADGINGRIWCYDAEEDAISMLDSIATTGGDASTSGSQGGAVANTTASFTFDTTATNYITDMITWGGVRFVAINNSGSADYQILRYRDDEPANRQAGTASGAAVTTLTTGVTDFDIPYQQKYLAGFDVSWKIDPNTTWATGQSILVEYNIDGAGWVDSGTTINESHADRNKGRTFVALSSPLLFTSMRARLTLSGSAAGTIQPPILLNLAPVAYQEVLELMVSLKNPVGNTRRGPSATSNSAWAARGYLKTLARAGSPVTVVDGYADPRPGQTTTYTMVIEEAEDIIVRDGEGTMRLILRTA